ncbi:MAG: RsmF rRNA methyltransferase first C-terminal domain-containing protein [Oscillospiraceae bacterium]|nr:RsmF rRNA methyltransferase first C-terminal domain-containing protein [Oscillospiraceae bacterium]
MNLPQKFEERMKNMLKTEYGKFIKSMDESPIFTGIRINTSKDGAREAVLKEFGNLERVPWCEDGFYADKSKISGNHPYHIAGLFYFQEPSAMSAVSALPIEKDDFILDLCAAPGGKATQVGARLGKNGLLVANEIIKGRANILSDNIERFGFTNAVVTNETPQKLAEKYPKFFDKIIVDAPCSGEGMFRKEPQAITEWSTEHTLSCAERQKRIIDCAMKMLKGGGYIVYSTCTFSPEENEGICAYILENYNVELAEPQSLNMLSRGRNEWAFSDFDVTKSRRIFPHKNKGEGHFTALFHSLDSDDYFDSKSKIIKSCDAESLYRQFEKEFLNISLNGEFCLFGENLYLKPKNIDIDKIKTVRAGLRLGICRKNRFEPSHALCLALKKEDFKNSADFSCGSDELKKYLMGNTLECKEKGWCAVTVDGFPIGWGKASGGILKNHFPKYLRLKK